MLIKGFIPIKLEIGSTQWGAIYIDRGFAILAVGVPDGGFDTLEQAQKACERWQEYV